MNAAGTGAVPSPPRAILFDWDNTLVDNWPAIHDALNTTLAAMGEVPWTLEETRARVRESLRDSFPRMFGGRWTEARTIFYDRFAEIHLDRLVPLPEAGEVLSWLSGEGIYLGVVSNKTGRYLRAEAERLGWSRWFGRLVGATDAEEDKPAQAPVVMALEGSGIAPGRDVWFAGDGAIDIQCAVNSGLSPVLLMSDGWERELSRHNLVQFVGSEYRVWGMKGLKRLVESRTAPISHE